jgi:transposase
VLQYQQENNLSDKETAVYFKIPNKGTICTWRKKYKKGGYELLSRDGRGNPKNMAAKKSKKNAEPKTELEKLREEVEWLRMENAILKKLNALIQEEEESEQGTKLESSEN